MYINANKGHFPLAYSNPITTPADGSTQTSVGPNVTLTANQSVTWSNVSIGYQDLAGDTSTPQAEHFQVFCFRICLTWRRQVRLSTGCRKFRFACDGNSLPASFRSRGSRT